MPTLEDTSTTVRATRKPRRAKRLWSLRVHRWTGFALMAWFVFEAVTGSYLTLGEDIDHWRSPSRYEHTTGDVGPKAAAAAATARIPGSLADTITFPSQAHGVYEILLKVEDGGGGGDLRRAYVDPGSGKVNAVTDPDRGIFTTVLQLHANFNLTKVLGIQTSTIIGWLGIGWLLNLVLGFFVMRRRRRAVRPSWAFRSGRRPRAFHLAVHNWTGLVILAPLMIAVLTGIAFQFPAQADDVVNLAFPGSSATDPRSTTPFSTPSADGRRISVDAVRDAAVSANLGTVQSITVPLGNPAGVYTVAVDAGGYSPRTGSGRTVTLYADQYSAKLLSLSDPAARSLAGAVTADWIPGLHFGFFASWFSKVLWLLIGVATVVLGVTALGMRKGRFPWQDQQRRAGALERRAGLDSAQLEFTSTADKPAPVDVPALDERNHR
ncbi:MAG: propeptide pepSY amd peptidase [Marmoricola sp.]|nr:propeptide pepSY amd peptidase [Marmoricola sp.]